MMISINDLNSDNKIADRANAWKKFFNPDPTKQAQEFIFSQKSNKLHHPPLKFDKSTLKSIPIQKYLASFRLR